MKKKLVAGLATGLFMCSMVSLANATPISLEGMGRIIEWTDLETQVGDMPGKIWGQSDTLGANKIGLYVEFANGLTGSVTYTDMSGLWNTNGFARSAVTATGFFTNAGSLHFLYNSPVTTTYPDALPIAWTSFVMPFSNNFDLDYNDHLGSDFRASISGWERAVIATYSSAYNPVPLPATILLLGSGLVGLVSSRIRLLP